MSDTPRTNARTEELVSMGCDITYPAYQYAKLAEQLEQQCSTLREALQQAEQDLAVAHNTIRTAMRTEELQRERAETAERERDEARNKALEEAAGLADAHKGHAAKRRKPLKQHHPDVREEIRAEERGEDIAASCIADAIRALKDTAAMQPTHTDD